MLDTNQKQSSGVHPSSETKWSQKKAFLKRREGLARFGVLGKKLPQKKSIKKTSFHAGTETSKAAESHIKPSERMSALSANNRKVRTKYLEVVTFVSDENFFRKLL